MIDKAICLFRNEQNWLLWFSFEKNDCNFYQFVI